MKRLGALVLAVLVVMAAMWIRDRRDSGPGDTLGAGNRLTCSTELARACEALVAEHDDLALTVEAAGATETRLAGLGPGADPGFDAWLVAGPYDKVARTTLTAASRADLLGAASAPLAHSRLGFWVHASRSTALEAHCGGAVSWACLLSAAGRQWDELGGEGLWGPLKPHIADPSESQGLLALGAATVAVAGAEADGLAVEESAELGAGLTALARSRAKPTVPSGAALSRMLAVGPAEVDVVIALEAEGSRFGANATSRARLIYPAPEAGSAVVALPRAGSGKGVEDLMELLDEKAGEVLARHGWASGGPPAATSGGTPPVGALLAVRRLWGEIR